jgi:hypothetical protein
VPRNPRERLVPATQFFDKIGRSDATIMNAAATRCGLPRIAKARRKSRRGVSAPVAPIPAAAVSVSARRVVDRPALSASW